MGGWRGHPSSLAALDAGRLPWPLLRKCEACKRPAMRADRFCCVHSWRVRKAPASSPGKAAARVLQGLHRFGLLPAELIAMPMWRALNAQPTGARAPLRLRMVLAWDTRDGQPLLWAGLVREAHQVAARPAQRAAVWPMLEVA
jgi:hypothetical protein